MYIIYILYININHTPGRGLTILLNIHMQRSTSLQLSLQSIYTNYTMFCIYNFRTLPFIILISITDTAACRSYWDELEEFRNHSEFSKTVNILLDIAKSSKKLRLQTTNMTIILLCTVTVFI
jgi:hypothetical protein